MDANEYLMGGGVTSAKFEKIGAKVSGVITRTPELQQQRHIETKAPLTWDDGSPKQQVKVVLQTEDKADEDDNGERAVYLKSGMLKAVQDAIRKAGEKGLTVGGKLAIKYVKDGEKKNKAFNAPKIYAAKYEAPDPLTLAAMAAAQPEPEEVEPVEESLDDF